jgi:hypothetical protein
MLNHLSCLLVAMASLTMAMPSGAITPLMPPVLRVKACVPASAQAQLQHAAIDTLVDFLGPSLDRAAFVKVTLWEGTSPEPGVSSYRKPPEMSDRDRAMLQASVGSRLADARNLEVLFVQSRNSGACRVAVDVLLSGPAAEPHCPRGTGDCLVECTEQGCVKLP